jgi:CrcB protein
MNIILAVFAGGGLGSVMRYGATAGAGRLFGAGALPYGTLAVNVLGCLAIGFLVEMWAVKFDAAPEIRAFAVTGFLGGFTTFSAFSMDVFKLAGTGRMLEAAAYAAASVFLSLLAVFGGVYLAKGVAAL